MIKDVTYLWYFYEEKGNAIVIHYATASGSRKWIGNVVLDDMELSVKDATVIRTELTRLAVSLHKLIGMKSSRGT